MKAEQVRRSFLVPLALGRSESDMTANGLLEELMLFRELLPRKRKLQILAMLALSDSNHPDQPVTASVASIAEAMGYERKERVNDGKRAFHPERYRIIEETGIFLRRKPIWLYIRRPSDRPRAGRPEYITYTQETSILQEFGFCYKDDSGHTVDLRCPTPDQKETYRLYEVVRGEASIWAIPELDAAGEVVRRADGTIRRRRANGISWRWSAFFADLIQQRGTHWVFALEDVTILRRYLTRPITFDLIWLILFHRSGQLQFGHDKLVKHLGIKGVRNRRRVEERLQVAFEEVYSEGIIKVLPECSTGGVYRWERAPRDDSTKAA